MNRAILLDCLPWALLWLALCALLVGLVRGGGKLRLGRLRRLAADQGGSAQTLSFVLTVPLFVMILLLVVQISQLMIAQVVVEYAAFAAARAAAVWIPARLPDSMEWENCISSYAVDADAPDQVFPTLDPLDPSYGPSDGGVTYRVASGSQKFEKIASAAVLACMPISPSRDVGVGLPAGSQAAGSVVRRAYEAIAPGAAGNARVARRLENKLAYAVKYTDVEVRFFHSNREPPLLTYYLRRDLAEFRANEIGWQDPITVTVKYDLALLPGPGRLLARFVVGAGGTPDRVAPRIRREGELYLYALKAKCTMGNEGEKSLMAHELHHLN